MWESTVGLMEAVALSDSDTSDLAGVGGASVGETEARERGRTVTHREELGNWAYVGPATACSEFAVM